MPRPHRKSKAAHKPRIDPHEVYRLMDQGLTQGEVGRQLHCDQSYVSLLLKRRREGSETPSPGAVQRNGDDGQRNPTTRKIPIADLCIDAGTQMREQLNFLTIVDYAKYMEDGSKFPPIIVYSDGESYWLADGFQRVEAAKSIGYVEMEADIRPGSLRDAVLFACGANAFHGERRTNADKRKSVLTLLHDPEWSQLHDRRIADICGVTHPFVGEMRKSLLPVVTVTTSIHQDEPNTSPSVDEHATGEHNATPPEPPSHELFPTTPPTTTSWLPRLIHEALAQLQHLGNAANLEGYAEYQDLRETLTALQEHIGREVPAHA